jgi:NTE family protein
MNKNGIVLSGGGTRGFAHLGVLHALDELGIKISAVSGSSAGALVGSLYSAGLKPKEIMRIFQKTGVLQNLKFSWSRLGLFKFDKLEALLLQHIGHNDFSKLNIPFYACATNLDSSEYKIFSEGELIMPVLASCAIPGIFKPIKIDGITYVDGGVLNNLPIEPLSDQCSFIMGVNIMPLEKDNQFTGASDIVFKCLLMSIRSNILSRIPKLDLYIEPAGISKYQAFKTDQAKALFDAGYNTTMSLFKEKNIEFEANLL